MTAWPDFIGWLQQKAEEAGENDLSLSLANATPESMSAYLRVLDRVLMVIESVDIPNDISSL